MTIRRLDHIGIAVDDLPAAIAFFERLGLELRSEGTVEGEWVDRIVGLTGVHAKLAFMRTPDGNGIFELFEFTSPAYEGDTAPPPAHAPGIRHLAFAVDDVKAAVEGLELVGTVEDFEDRYRLCYVRGPGGIIVELVEELNRR